MQRHWKWLVPALAGIGLLAAVGPNPRFLEELVIGGGFGDAVDGGADFEKTGVINTDGDINTDGVFKTGGTQIAATDLSDGPSIAHTNEAETISSDWQFNGDTGFGKAGSRPIDVAAPAATDALRIEDTTNNRWLQLGHGDSVATLDTSTGTARIDFSLGGAAALRITNTLDAQFLSDLTIDGDAAVDGDAVIDGNLTVGDGANDQEVSVDGGAGSARQMTFETNGFLRTRLGVSNDAETGDNAGSNFFLALHADNGALTDTPVFIARDAGGPIQLGGNGRPVVYHAELSADPDDPEDGSYAVWLSDGLGSGDAGDVMVKITSGGTTKTVTLVDFSAH